MSAKALVMVDRGAAIALEESLSKNQAIDLLCDIARAELGETTSDVAVLNWIERRIEAVARVRHDRPPKIVARFNRLHEASRRYVESASKAGRLHLHESEGSGLR